MTEMPPPSPSLDSEASSGPNLASLSKEVRIRLAIDAVRASGTNSDGRFNLSLRQAAKEFDVARSTLTGRFNGMPTRKEAHEHEQKLQPAQEEVLVEWIKVMGQ
jgi:transposase